MRSSLVIPVFLAILMCGVAEAQTGVPLPSPSDVIQIQGLGPKGGCGYNISKSDVVRNEIQATYAGAGRCSEYSPRMYFDYRIAAIKGEEERPGDVTVSGFFVHYGVEWYRSSAKANEVIGRFDGAASNVSAPAPRQATSAPASQSAADDLGACGIPVSTGLTVQAQAEAQRIGTCDQIRQIYGVQ